MQKELNFSERQHFRYVWLCGVLILTSFMMLFCVLRLIFTDMQLASKIPIYTLLIGCTMLSFFFTYMFLNFRLDTHIGADGVYVRIFPFQLRYEHYCWSSIRKVSVRQYNPLQEFGGWGVKNLGKTRALHVSGNKGIQLELSDGVRLLIGTNKEREAQDILKRLGHQDDEKKKLYWNVPFPN
jgi:hypothetical protein